MIGPGAGLPGGGDAGGGGRRPADCMLGHGLFAGADALCAQLASRTSARLSSLAMGSPRASVR